MLDEHDLGWLATLNIPPETLDNPSFIDTLNQLSRQGNIDLRSEADTDQKAAVIQARYNFFALLGLGEKITEMSGLTHTLTSPESFILLQREARLLGLDGLAIIKGLSTLFRGSDIRIRRTFEVLQELDLKPAQVINRFPKLLGLSEENIKSKFVFFQRTVKLLKWEYTAEELLNAYPILLGASFGKLQILRRLSAQSLTPESRDCPPVRVGRASTMPLEAYMIALREMDEGEQLSLDELNKQARRIQESLPQPARRAKAKTISRQANATLGRRACQMYLEYTKA